MKIKRLEVYNFIIFKNIDLTFDSDSYFITGENRDEQGAESNGSGKSLLCQSIVWILFDDLPRKSIKKNDVIGPFDNRVFGKLTLEIAGDEIVIARSRSGNKSSVQIYKNGNDISPHKVADANTKIEELIGVSSSVVYQSAFVDRNSISILAMTPAQARQVIVELVGLNRFDDDLKEIKSKRKEKQSKKAEIQEEYLIIQSQRKMAEISLKNARESLANTERSIEEHKASLGKFRESYERDLKNVIDKLVDIKSQQSKYDGIQERLEKAKSAKQLVEVQRGMIDEEVSILNKHVSSLSSLISSSNDVEQRYKNIFENATGKCAFCGTPMNEAHNVEKMREGLEAEYSQFITEKGSIELRIKKKEISIQKMKDTLKDLEKGLSEYEEVRGLWHEYNDLLRQAKALLDRKRQLEQYLEQQDGRVPKSMIESKASLEHRISCLEEGIKEYEQDEQIELEKIAVVEEDIKALDLLAMVLQKIKEEVFNSFVSNLSSLIEKNLALIGDGDYECQFNDDGSQLEILFRNRSKLEYIHFFSFSTGEQARIATAVSSALNDALNIGFFVNDEGLGGLDAPGIEAVLDFILEVNRGKLMLFVSHQNEMRDYFVGKQNIHVIKEDGVASVEVRRIV